MPNSAGAEWVMVRILNNKTWEGSGAKKKKAKCLGSSGLIRNFFSVGPKSVVQALQAWL